MRRLPKVLICIAAFLGSTTTTFGASYAMHTAQPGDSLYSIAKQYNKDFKTIQEINLHTGDELRVGELVKLAPVSGERDIEIYVNGNKIHPDQSPYMENNTTFVPIRFVAEALQVDNIQWDGAAQKATLIKEDVVIELPIGSNTAYINKQSIGLGAKINIFNGRTFVPLRLIVEAFHGEVQWDGDDYAVGITTPGHTPVPLPAKMAIYEQKTMAAKTTVTVTYSEEDLYWLSRIVEAEAKGESFEGKLAVANCVLNRTKSSDFPNTIKGVIFDQNHGYQYEPVMRGTIYNTPSADSVKAAKSALEGENNIGDSLYFLNPRTATNSWIMRNRKFYKRIDNHDFYL